MKLLTFFALATGLSFAQSTVSTAKSVYVLPMPGGLDQFLAQRLTEQSVLQVVTDVSKADVVVTDRIGEKLQETLKDLAAPPVDDTQPHKAGSTDTFAHASMRPLSGSRGTVFLVDRTSGNVVWSTIEVPKSNSAKDLSASANRIVDRLERARSAKK